MFRKPEEQNIPIDGGLTCNVRPYAGGSIITFTDKDGNDLTCIPDDLRMYDLTVWPHHCMILTSPAHIVLNHHNYYELRRYRRDGSFVRLLEFNFMWKIAPPPTEDKFGSDAQKPLVNPNALRIRNWDQLRDVVFEEY